MHASTICERSKDCWSVEKSNEPATLAALRRQPSAAARLRSQVGTQVSVRMISTVAEPRVLATGRADDQGLVALAFDIPQIGRGTAALIITAVSSIGRAELKHLL